MAYSAEPEAKAEPKAKAPVSTVTHRYIKDCFESSEQTTANARTLSERCRDYYDNKQLTDTELTALQKRKQPPVVINRIKRKINYIVGLEIKKRSDPKAFPRTPKHEKDADSATEALRYATDRANFKEIKTAVATELMIEGGPTGAYIGIEKKKNRYEVTVTHIPWDRCYYDPHSRRADFGDATFKGFVTWMDQAVAEKRFPDAKGVIQATIETACANSKTYDDRPTNQKWVRTKEKRIRIIEHYFEDETGWKCAKITEAGWIKEPEPVAFVDQDGEPECPLELVSANVDRQNNRYGEVVELIDLQDEINKRRSKSLHLLTMRQARASRGLGNPDKLAMDLTDPGKVIVADDGEFEILPTGDMARGQMELLAQATQEMDGAGANASLQGKGPDAASGRAILANQQGGQIELEPLMDKLSFWELRCCKQIWNRIRQYCTAEWWIAVTDEVKNVRWVGLNRPMTNAEYAERQGMDPEQFAQSGLDPNAPAIDPQTGQPMIANNIAELEVDIILDRGPDTVTLEQEQFDTLAKVPGIPPDMLIEVSSLRNKDKILKRIRGEEGPDGKPAEPPPPPPEIVKAQMDAAEKQKDREVQVQTAVGDRQAEEARAIAAASLEKEKLEAAERQAQRQFELDKMKLAFEDRKLQLEERKLSIEEDRLRLDAASLRVDAANADADRDASADNAERERDVKREGFRQKQTQRPKKAA